MLMPFIPAILHWLVSAFALLMTSWLVRGLEIDRFTSALWASLIIGLVNYFLAPLLLFLTLPINILTLGLFTFVVNGILLKISAALSPNFKVKSWLSAIVGALILSVLSTILHYLFV